MLKRKNVNFLDYQKGIHLDFVYAVIHAYLYIQQSILCLVLNYITLFLLSMAVQFKAGIFQASFTVKIRHPPMPKFYNPGPKNGKTNN